MAAGNMPDPVRPRTGAVRMRSGKSPAGPPMGLESGIAAWRLLAQLQDLGEELNNGPQTAMSTAAIGLADPDWEAR